MHILLAGLSIAAAVYFFVLRARNAAHLAGDVVNAFGDARLALRRGQFRRRANIHPADSIERPSEAIAGIAAGFIELDGPPSRERLAALETAFCTSLRTDRAGAQELLSYGRWIVAQCGTPNAAILRLSRKLNRIQDPGAGVPLMEILNAVSVNEPMGDRQREALQDIALQLNLR